MLGECKQANEIWLIFKEWIGLAFTNYLHVSFENIILDISENDKEDEDKED